MNWNWIELFYLQLYQMGQGVHQKVPSRAQIILNCDSKLLETTKIWSYSSKKSKSTNKLWILIQISVRYKYWIFKFIVQLVVNKPSNFWKIQVSVVVLLLEFYFFSDSFYLLLEFGEDNLMLEIRNCCKKIWNWWMSRLKRDVKCNWGLRKSKIIPVEITMVFFVNKMKLHLGLGLEKWNQKNLEMSKIRCVSGKLFIQIYIIKRRVKTRNCAIRFDHKTSRTYIKVLTIRLGCI